jgi:hypothetical protein
VAIKKKVFAGHPLSRRAGHWFRAEVAMLVNPSSIYEAE